MKEYYCNKIANDLIIDGNLKKPEWERAAAVLLLDTLTGDRPKQSTWVRLLWNDCFLYAAFECEDDYINATMTEYNDKLYEEEVVEIFLDDNKDLKTYIEIEVNPLNALLHYSIHNDLEGRFHGFARVEKTIVSAVQHNKEEGLWSVEIAVPFTEFITAKHCPPKKGDRWLMNLYRIDRPLDGKDEYSAWSPTGLINFHMPYKFGEIIFTD